MTSRQQTNGMIDQSAIRPICGRQDAWLELASFVSCFATWMSRKKHDSAWLQARPILRWLPHESVHNNHGEPHLTIQGSIIHTRVPYLILGSRFNTGKTYVILGKHVQYQGKAFSSRETYLILGTRTQHQGNRFNTRETYLILGNICNTREHIQRYREPHIILEIISNTTEPCLILGTHT